MRASSDPRAVWLCLAISSLLTGCASRPESQLTLRSRIETSKGSRQWNVISSTSDFDPAKTALLICDMWDRHWCSSATQRVGELARKIEPVVELARKHGVLVIHSPSSTIAYYRQNPARISMLRTPALDPPADLALTDPPLPIDDSDGGCDTPNNPVPPNTRVWSRENPAISIERNDLISDDGHEVYSALKAHHIDTVLFTGVHTNMCILKRTFGIRQMTRWGVHCVLIRDLTDAMYNPAKPPYVSHSQGTELVIEYIEKYWAPTVTSRDLEKALRRSNERRPPE